MGGLLLYAVAVGCLLAFAAVSGVSPRRGVAALAGAPWWSYGGGLCNVCFVLVGAVATRRIGSAAFTVTTLTCAIAMALGLDAFGALGLERHPLVRQRAVGAALAVAGVLLAVLIQPRTRPWQRKSLNEMTTRRTFNTMLAAGAALAALAALPPAAGAEVPGAQASGLKVAFSFDTVCNAVATTPSGQVFVGFPRLTGEPGVKLARMVEGKPKPFPDEAWNGWKTGDDPAHAIVRLNAMRIGPDGSLWVVDVGAPAYDTPIVPGGPKILRFDPASGTLLRSYPIAPPAIEAKSYIDDIRFNGRHATITDAGVPGLILLDLDSGATRRVLDHKPSTTDERPMRARGRVLTGPDGEQTRIQADQQEVSPDGRHLYFMPCSGPLYRVAYAALLDTSLSDAALSAEVAMFADVPTTGGTAIAADGTIYLSDTDRSRILTVSPEGKIATLIEDERLDWPDAMWIDGAGDLWIPAAQIDRTPPMNGGRDDLKPPVAVYTLHIGAKPPAIDHA